MEDSFFGLNHQLWEELWQLQFLELLLLPPAGKAAVQEQNLKSSHVACNLLLMFFFGYLQDSKKRRANILKKNGHRNES